MNTTGMILLIFGLIAICASFFFIIKDTLAFQKNSIRLRLEKKELIRYALYIGASAIGFALLLSSSFVFHPEWQDILTHTMGVYKGESINYTGNLSLVIIGSFFFGGALALFVPTFWIHVFKEKKEEKQAKLVRILYYVSIPLLIFSFWMWSEGLADYMYYPLPNGISITESGFAISTSQNNPGGFHVAFYGVVILIGALLCLFVSDQRMYKRYHKHGLLEIIFIVAFPAGIVGARIWYVVGNWSREFANRDFYHVFEIWNGGLTILGGAAFGILVGALMAKFSKKGLDARWTVDEVVPSVLIGQAVGRWGNFFNNEVYGRAVSVDYFRWLPTWLVEQMHISTASASTTTAGEGMIYVPLFLIECCLSIAGYFIIQYVVGKLLKKYTAEGDRLGCYFLWYGIVRFILEPFRDSNFNMGTDNAWSICNSLIYILIGIMIIASAHLHDYYIEKKKGNFFPLISAGLLIPTFLFPLLPSLTTSTQRDGAGTIVSYYGYDLIFSGKTPLFLVAFILSGLALVLFVVSYFILKKNNKVGMYVLYGANGVSLIGTILYLVGKNMNSLGNDLYINLSYGFILSGFFSLIASVISFVYILDTKKIAKMEGEVSNEAV